MPSVGDCMHVLAGPCIDGPCGHVATKGDPLPRATALLAARPVVQCEDRLRTERPRVIDPHWQLFTL